VSVDDGSERGCQVSERIDGVELAGLDQRSDGRPILGSGVVSGKESVLAIQGNARSFCPCRRCRGSLSLASLLRPEGCIRRVEQRATGLFLKVLGPTGVVVSISGWMIDPVVCGGMTMGLARVDLAALVELNTLVTIADKPAFFRGGRRITQEEDDEIPQYAGAGVSPAARPDIQTPDARGTERQGSQEGGIDAGLPPDGGRRFGLRGDALI
jgi:hypothetical protein